jgi:hypothetical protein
MYRQYGSYFKFNWKISIQTTLYGLLFGFFLLREPSHVGNGGTSADGHVKNGGNPFGPETSPTKPKATGLFLLKNVLLHGSVADPDPDPGLIKDDPITAFLECVKAINTLVICFFYFLVHEYTF